MKTRDTRDSENNSTRSAAQILVVDDTPANLKLLVDMLTNSGYQVRAAGSGPLALRSIAVEQPDLILLDIRMPGIDGYEVCRRLKDDERYSDIPVIFLSALNDVPGMIRGIETGAVDYITKPFEPAEVLARIGTHLKLRRLQREMETLVAERTRELHEACRFLEESEERYKTMFEKNVAAIAIVEEDLTISLCNPEFQRLSGFSREEIEGSMLWTDFSADEEEKKKLGNYHRLRMDDPDSAPRNYEYRLRDKTGSPRTLFISVNFLPGTRKSLVTMVDVTDRNRAMA